MKAMLCAVLFAAMAGTTPAYSQQAVKIATIAPESSLYVRALREMCEAWKKGTNGRIRCTVYANTKGGEDVILRGMRGSSRNPHAAQLSAISLGHLDHAFNVFGLPMFFESYAEAERVLEKLEPLFEKRLEGKQLKALNFAYAGWIHIFSKEPVTSVADLKRLKMYTSAGEDEMAKWYRDNGFRPIPLDATQMLEQLQTGGIEAAPGPPIYAHILNWYSSAPHMMGLGFAPLIGATVMSLEVWNRISRQDQAVVLQEARKAGARLRREVPAQEKEHIAAMKKRKLTVSEVDISEWREMAEQLAQSMLGVKMVPREVYDIARRERDAARAGK